MELRGYFFIIIYIEYNGIDIKLIVILVIVKFSKK